eukprot:3792104-Heterocapsa_arctica.AAC.1
MAIKGNGKDKGSLGKAKAKGKAKPTLKNAIKGKGKGKDMGIKGKDVPCARLDVDAYTPAQEMVEADV